MKATLIKIDPPKNALKLDKRGQPISYRRLYFELEGGAWANTDVVSTFRNYRYWKPVIEAGKGVIVDGVILKSADKIDADSPVKVVERPAKEQTLL